MAGTTTNFAIPYPSSTDYVTDGATAMKSLADQVDAAMFTGASAGNLLINGAMQVSQRTAVGTASSAFTTSEYYTADRWRTEINTMGTWQQTTIAQAPTGSGFTNSLKMDCTVADASPSAGDYLMVQQKIEGQNLQTVRKGTASAQTLTLSFWVASFQTGTFICELVAGSRSCSKSYTVNASNTFEYKTITFPADTVTVIPNTNAEGLSVNWWLGAGTTYTSGTLATTWGATTNANRAVGQINSALADTGLWYMTGAQLTVGSVATPFQFKSYADDLAACQRYFTVIGFPSAVLQFIGNAAMQTAGAFESYLPLPVQMRSAPSLYATSGASYYGIYVLNVEKRVDTLTNASNNPYNLRLYGSLVSTTSTAGAAGGLFANNASSFVAGNAELT